MKKGLVTFCIIFLVIMQTFAIGTTKVENGDETLNPNKITLGVGGVLEVFTSEEMENFDPGLGFSVHLGLGNYVSGYFDMTFSKQHKIMSGVQASLQDQFIIGALTIPIINDGNSIFKLGGGCNLIRTKTTGDFFGITSNSVELTNGFCILAEITSNTFTGCVKYIVPSEGDISEGSILISAMVNLI